MTEDKEAAKVVPHSHLLIDHTVIIDSLMGALHEFEYCACEEMLSVRDNPHMTLSLVYQLFLRHHHRNLDKILQT